MHLIDSEQVDRRLSQKFKSAMLITDADNRFRSPRRVPPEHVSSIRHSFVNCTWSMMTVSWEPSPEEVDQSDIVAQVALKTCCDPPASTTLLTL